MRMEDFAACGRGLLMTAVFQLVSRASGVGAVVGPRSAMAAWRAATWDSVTMRRLFGSMAAMVMLMPATSRSPATELWPVWRASHGTSL